MRKADYSVTMAAPLAGIVLLSCFHDMLSAQTHGHWPQFRGPEARGVAGNTRLPNRWSASENIAWKTDVPGRGWSSPIVWGNRVFLTTAVNRGDLETPKKGLYFGGNRPEPRAVRLDYRVLCLDLASGKVLWERSVHQGASTNPIHLKNSFASETPVTDGQRVYAYFGNLGLYCLDLEGNPVWSRPFEPRAMRNGWGTAASPVLHGDRLYIVNDNDEESYLLCLDKRTGKDVWRVVRDEKSNWSTPFIWQNDRRTEIVTAGTDKVRSYDLEGKLLWWFTGMSSITIATPYADQGLLYISSGYVNDNQRPLYALRLGGSGDISLESHHTGNEFIAWCRPKAAPYNPTTLVYDDRLYVLYDRSLIACFRSRTGEPVYELRRLPEGRHFTASPWAYGGKIFCLNEDGVTFVVRSDDEFELLHTNELAEDDMCMATPAIVGDRLLIRTSMRVYCVRQSASLPAH
ncbi:MAG: PQQ-binding-like beta-propeller repeat protein [Pirellulales bacterium]|nr:PQQ-binding-like beta-propeller repeat protein [Pirellulales bacterium]